MCPRVKMAKGNSYASMLAENIAEFKIAALRVCTSYAKCFDESSACNAEDKLLELRPTAVTTYKRASSARSSAMMECTPAQPTAWRLRAARACASPPAFEPRIPNTKDKDQENGGSPSSRATGLQR